MSTELWLAKLVTRELYYLGSRGPRNDWLDISCMVMPNKIDSAISFPLPCDAPEPIKKWANDLNVVLVTDGAELGYGGVIHMLKNYTETGHRVR